MVPLVYHASYSQLALPQHHRFPITKYQALYQYLRDNKIAPPEAFHLPQAVTPQWLSQIHCPDYVAQFIQQSLADKAIRRLGFPLSDRLTQRTLYSIGGTHLACELALTHGVALQLSGGYHHAHYDFGSGYCVFNDLISAALHAQRLDGVDTVLIFDCDVHQGDGTAAMGQKYDNIYTCSIHCQENFPARKQHSDLDIELARGTQDADYLETVTQTLALAIRLYRPDLILYDAGVDVHQDDRLGHLNISTLGIYQRDHLVLETTKKAGIPIACVVGGGYSHDIQELSERHAQVFIAAHAIW
ncbi:MULTISPECIES: histone deacetylase family protein [Shewanella]|uniref:Histone deacetylase n=1 Tax=Shewanella marisflavi TaxID=260364 RepID=A0ABX5WLC4_9GAMM|nr:MULTISPECIES: histone deacetylase [Shewanella]QDF74856.1 histone deacetylase [Shewanella marisflavi]